MCFVIQLTVQQTSGWDINGLLFKQIFYYQSARLAVRCELLIAMYIKL